MNTTALLVIDVQQSFEHMPFWTERGMAEYQSRQNALIAHAREKSWPVVFVYHLSRGAFSAESGFVSPMSWVDRNPEDPVFYKRVHNALAESGLKPWLEAKGISRLLISGIRTEQCCETTARVASDDGFEVEYILDATHTFDMQLLDGNSVSADTIKNHSAMVLKGRFATVSTVTDFVVRPELTAINARCPRSGHAISSDSLTQYRGWTVGFCNQGCRDSFASDNSLSPLDCLYFDRLIARQAVDRAYS